MTLAGTITYVVGERQLAIIDPGTAARAHLDTLADAARNAGSVTILLTHDHPDHAGGAAELGRRLDAPVRGIAAGQDAPPLADGDAIATDEGELVVLATPGHCPDHAAFHWPAQDAVFCGDLMMGGLDTAVVAAPEGNLGAYLASLERLRTLRPRIIYPSHGPPFTDADEAVGRYVAHRRERERQVLDALAAGARGTEAITDAVYGDLLNPGLRPFAEAAVEAYLLHLRETGRLDGSETP
jgi:glyoxylase-like metal-dependent hydrolase (beta-lactamase superfamily II)